MNKYLFLFGTVMDTKCGSKDDCLCKNHVDRNQCWTAMRLVVALILLVAAGLKAYQLATAPSLGEGLFHARWFNIFVVEFELFFGVWLLFGMLPKLTWLATTMLFSIFALVSFYKAISGEISCGCFGNVEVNPWITAGVDLSVVGLLGIFRPQENFSCRIPKRPLLLYCGFCVLLGVVVYCWISQMVFERLEQVGQVLERNTVQLEPEKWVGKEFPLQDYVMNGRELTHGKWLVLLFRRGCSDCETVKRNLAGNKDTSIAVLETSGKNMLHYPAENTVHEFRLVTDIDWLVETPVIIVLDNGIVRNVQTRKQLLSPKSEDIFFTQSDTITILGNNLAERQRGFQ